LTNTHSKVDEISTGLQQSILQDINTSIEVIDKKIFQISEALKNNTYQIIKHNYEAIQVAEINTRTFDKYKKIYRGQEIVLLATGPTLNFYEPLPDVISIGVNAAVLYNKVKLDFLFVQDKWAVEKYEKEIIEYPCKKFFGTGGSQPHCMPVKYTDIPNAEEYVRYLGPLENRTCHYDITKAPLGDVGGSVIFSAFHFVLWTYPKRIYLVGCDCTTANQSGASVIHFTDRSFPNDIFLHAQLFNAWQKMKEFQQTYYPDTEVFSINPVGLKGIFQDIFTESYLMEHPAI
jgi:hypothetical protein